jgi:FtsH-binding integral membrane protein
MMFMVGRPPLFLMIMFIGWVLAPFLAFVFVEQRARRRSQPIAASLYWTIIVITVLSLAIYAIPAFGPIRPQPAKYFTAWPLLSLMLMTPGIRRALGRTSG